MYIEGVLFLMILAGVPAVVTRFAGPLMWTFYLPSQVILTLSGEGERADVCMDDDGFAGKG